MALARMEWMKTSASNVSARSAVLPSSDRRSSTTLRLPRLTFTKTPLIPGSGPTEMWRVLSPSGGSILMTSAPMSAMICVQYGPITIAVRSTTRTPDSGPKCPVGLGLPALTTLGSFPLSSIAQLLIRPLPSLHRRWAHREAVTEVFDVTVGYDGKHQRRVHVPDRIQIFADLLDRPRWAKHAGRLGNDDSGHAPGDGNQHLTGDRAGFMSQPAHHRCHLIGAHRRIGPNIQPLSHSGSRGGNDDIAQHVIRGTFESDDVGQADDARLGYGVVG